jgi:hypothetical protein
MPIKGYLSTADRDILAKYAAKSALPIADVGCHHGLSASVIAQNAPERTIYAVDQHASFTGVNGVAFGPEDRAAFYENMVTEGLSTQVSLVGLPSRLAAQAFPAESLGMVFIDGDHREALQDIVAWFPALAPSGYMLMHDRDLAPVQHANEWASQGEDLAMVEQTGLIAVMQKHPPRLTHAKDGRRLVFIHIPKTAGLSVLYHVARPRGVENWNHMTALQYRSHMGAAYSRALSFSIFRDPASRMYSAWNYLRRQTPHHRWWHSDAGERAVVNQMGDTFHDFVMAFTEAHWSLPHFMPQHMFLCDGDRRIVEKLLRYEHLTDDWAALMDDCGVSRTLPHNNRTPRSTKPQWGSTVQEKIEKLYKEDYSIAAQLAP